MALPSHVKTTILYGPLSEGVAYQNTLYWTVPSGAIVSTNVAALMNSMMAIFAPLYQAVMIDQWAFFGINCMYKNGSAEVEGSSTSTPVVGSEAGDCLPNEDAIVIRRKTGQSGRNKRGRIFITGVPETFVTNEILNVGPTASYKAIANKIDQQMVLSPGGVVFTPVTPNWKDGQLTVVTNCQVVLTTMSRRDRRKSKPVRAEGVIGI